MATSFYFNKAAVSEQRLLEDLTIESIKINGIDAYYMPRTLFNKDQIFKEDVLSTFKRGYFIEMYPKNVQGFGGEKDILTKFGVEIREQITFVMSRRRYEDEVGDYESRVNRPLEGDLIYFPINDGLYEVKFVDHDLPFYQLSNRHVYELKCEKFEYSVERLDTGIEAIDDIETRFTLDDVGVYELVTEAEVVLTTQAGDNIILERIDIEQQDPGAQNTQFQIESDGIFDFSDKNPFGERI